MQVPKKTFARWRRKYRHGDATKIVELAKSKLKPANRRSVSIGLNGGGIDEKTIEAIDNYYDSLEN